MSRRDSILVTFGAEEIAPIRAYAARAGIDTSEAVRRIALREAGALSPPAVAPEPVEVERLVEVERARPPSRGEFAALRALIEFGSYSFEAACAAVFPAAME